MIYLHCSKHDKDWHRAVISRLLSVAHLKLELKRILKNLMKKRTVSELHCKLDIIIKTILEGTQNPSHCLMAASFGHRDQTPLSWVVTIHQCLPCVQEGLSVLQRPRFSLRIGHWLDLKLRHDLILFFCVDGSEPSALRLALCAFTRDKVNKRVSRDGRQDRPDGSWKKQRQTRFFSLREESGKLATRQLR